MTCPRCSVAELSPLTGICELCGYAAEANVAVAPADATIEIARRQLAHEFDFEEPIGRSPRSIVFRAKEKSSKRAVILKVLPRGTDAPDAEVSFRSTLDAFSDFDHPHLVPLLRYGSTDSLFWYAMEPLDSTSLREMLRERRRMGPRSCRRIVTQVVSALEYLHRRGVVHGAIKPENVFVDKEGWVHVADPTFMRPRRLPAGAPRPAWVSPEEAERGERLPAADQYALAVLVYECLGGKLPEDPPMPLHRTASDVPASLARAVERALSGDPHRRFPSCADFLWALEEHDAPVPDAQPTGKVTQEVVLIHDWEPPEDPWKPLLVLGRAAAVVVVGLVLWFSVPAIMALLRPPPGMVTLATPPASTTPATATPDPVGSPASPAPSSAPPTVDRRQIPGAAPTPTPPRAAVTAPQARPSAPLSGSARLFVNSNPWGQVYLDGVLIGNTPKADIELAPGTHALRVVRSGFTTYERTLTVGTGETVRLTDIVLEPRRP